MNKYEIIYSYFDENKQGRQYNKHITGSTIAEVVRKMRKHLANNKTLYHIERVSQNLYSHDWEQYGSEFQAFN